MNRGDAPETVLPRTTLNPWVPMAVIIVGTTMVILDTTIVNVALHQIGADLGARNGIEWVVSAYLLGVCVSQPATGWLADRVGRKIMFITSLTAFVCASLACATAPSLGALIAFRALQGLGGGALMPVGMAMALELFPKQRHGRAIAVWGMSAMVAPAIGPTVGGWLVTSVSWRYLFLINIPIGACSVVAAAKLLPLTGHRQRRPFDILGLLLGSGGLAMTVLGLSEANTWGWSSPVTIAVLLAGAASLLVFVRHELNIDHPMIQLRMFSERSFRLAMGVMVFVWVGNYARLVFVPLQLEDLRGETALRVGLLFFPPAVVTAVAMQIGGRMVDSIGPRLPILLGCATTLVSMIGFSRLTLTTPLAVVCAFLAVQGVGFGLVSAPAMVAGLSDLPRELTAQGTAVRSLTNQMSGALSVASLGAVVAARMGTHPSQAHAQSAYNGAFVAASIGLLISLILASRLPRQRTEVVPDLDEALALAAD